MARLSSHARVENLGRTVGRTVGRSVLSSVGRLVGRCAGEWHALQKATSQDPVAIVVPHDRGFVVVAIVVPHSIIRGFVVAQSDVFGFSTPTEKIS